MHEARRFGGIDRLHLGSIPIQILAGPEGDDARQADFGELAAGVEIREGVALAAVLYSLFIWPVVSVSVSFSSCNLFISKALLNTREM